MLAAFGQSKKFQIEDKAITMSGVDTMAGQTIQIKTASGKQFSAYLATPETGKGPGVVLCQEIFGVNAAMREKADFLAEEGYTVLVPDLFWRAAPNIELGYTPEDFQKAFELYQQYDENLGVEDIQDSLAFKDTTRM